MNSCLTAILKEPEALSQMQQCCPLFLTKHGDLDRKSGLSKFRHGALNMEAVISSRLLIQAKKAHKFGISTNAAEFPFICSPPLSCAETATNGTETDCLGTELPLTIPHKSNELLYCLIQVNSMIHHRSEIPVFKRTNKTNCDGWAFC